MQKFWMRRWRKSAMSARRAVLKGDGAIFAINNHAEPALATLRYKLKDAAIEAAEESFDAGGAKVHARNVFDSRRENAPT